MQKSNFNSAYSAKIISHNHECKCMHYSVLTPSGESHTSPYEDCDSDVFSLERRLEMNAVGDGVSPSFRSSRLAMTDEVNKSISNFKNND